MTEARRAAIIGLSGTRLTEDEAALLRVAQPLGVILFARNIDRPAQLRALTQSIRGILGEATPILIDQEGGRVARLRPPDWPAFPAAAAFEGCDAPAVHANAALIGMECAAVGLDVVCAPCLDLRLPEAHGVIGDRAFSADPREVARLGAAMLHGLQQAGCIPVIKHVPGHGRAMADSHLELPRVTATRAELALDCLPFRAVADHGAWAMTAHILYDALDAALPATLSRQVIDRVIRGAIGFTGFLLSDDIAMKALTGVPGELARAAIAAGCDAVLHCTGVLHQSAAVLDATPFLTPAALARLESARIAMQAARAQLDPAALIAARDQALADAA